MNGLDPFDLEILVRMYDEGIILTDYLPIERAASKIRWTQLSASFQVKKGFKGVLKRLKSRGLVTDQGKSLEVVSLTKYGVILAREELARRSRASSDAKK
jgi:hypothetical protein